MRQKGESKNRCYKKNKACQIFQKANTCTYQGVRNVRFSKNLACFVFIVTPVLRFILLPYYRRILRRLKGSIKHLVKELYHCLNSVLQKLVAFQSLISVLLTVGSDRWHLRQNLKYLLIAYTDISLY